MPDIKTSPDAKKLADAVAVAKDKLGPLAVANLLDHHAHVARAENRSGEYPRVMYHKDGGTQTVLSKADEEGLGDGWSREPSDVHRGIYSRDSVAGTTEDIEAEVALRRRNRRSNRAEVTETLENRTPDVPRTTIVGNTTIEHPPEGDTTVVPPVPNNGAAK